MRRLSILALFVVACSGPPGGSVLTPTADTNDVETPTPAAIAASSAADLTAPPELAGEWHTAISDADRVTLTLTGNAYHIQRGPNSGNGGFAVRGDEIRFVRSTICNGIGVYRWSVDGGSLLFTSIQPDACPGRADAIDGRTYTRGAPDASN